MKIAIASGKGGTGKTTVSASLIFVWDEPIIAVDLDVEEPNLHLFLHPKITETKKAFTGVPIVDLEKCDGCGKCVELCQFNALSLVNGKVTVFPNMCHSCGGCTLICPQKAISHGERELGEIVYGKIYNKGKADTDFIMGRLKIGEAMSPPLIRKIKDSLSVFLDSQLNKKDIIIDSPPGTSCPAINSVIDSGFIVLVTEPTPFGFNDLKLAREAFESLNKPMGVVINRAGLGDNSVYEYCKSTNLKILAEIPFDRKIAENYSKGKVISEISQKYKDIFKSLAKEIKSYA